jgi:cysteinyl-tRNA synthetase
MHGAFLNLEGEKRMGKSEGNKITLATVEEWGFTPLEFRYLVMLSHYRSPLAFSLETLESAAQAHRRLRKHVEAWTQAARQTGGTEPDPAWRDHAYVDEFVSAIADDMNTARVVAVLWTLARDPEVDPATKLALVDLFDRVLGLDLATPPEPDDVPDDVRALAELRWQMRTERNFAESDRLRDELLAVGWTMQDGRDGYELVPVP